MTLSSASVHSIILSDQDLCVSHWAAERESRLRNLQLESEVKLLLDKYDLEMFDLHHKIQELESK